MLQVFRGYLRARPLDDQLRRIASRREGRLVVDQVFGTVSRGAVEPFFSPWLKGVIQGANGLIRGIQPSSHGGGSSGGKVGLKGSGDKKSRFLVLAVHRPASKWCNCVGIAPLH